MECFSVPTYYLSWCCRCRVELLQSGLPDFY
jgi:hypothetical protein